MTERRLAALTRVYTLCTADPLPAGLDKAPPGFATQVAELKKSIADAASLMTVQGAGLLVTAHATQERRVLRQALRERQLRPLSQAARVLEQTHPGLVQHFRFPFANIREAQLLNVASAMASEASRPEFMPLFSAQLGADFLDRLNGAIQAITTSGDTNESGRRGHIAATTGVSTALADGRKAVQYLLAMVHACCSELAKTDSVAAAQTLRRFQTAARIERPAKGINKSITPTGNSSASVQAPAVAPAGGSQVTAAQTAAAGGLVQSIGTSSIAVSEHAPSSTLRAAA